jgi:hypothetical protein
MAEIVEFLDFINRPVLLKLLKHNVSGTGSTPVFRGAAGGTYSMWSGDSGCLFLKDRTG